MATKDIISSLRVLSTSLAHTDITKSTLFQDAAAEIERLDKALYEEKEKTRRLTRELIPLKEYDREQHKILTMKAGHVAAIAGPMFVGDPKKLAKAVVIQKLGRELDEAGMIQWNVKTDANGRVTAEATLRVAHPIAEYIPADPGWFARNHIDPDSPLMTE